MECVEGIVSRSSVLFHKASDEGSQVNDGNIIRSWRKMDLCYAVAENLVTQLPEIIVEVENASNELINKNV